MAAPSGTKWGSKVNDKGRIGISYAINYINPSDSVSVTISIWFWSKYGVQDSGNTFYFSNKASSTSNSRGSRTIYHNVNSGGGWSTSNQTRLGKYTYTMSRKESKRTIKCAARFTGVDWVGGTMKVVASYTVPALPKYNITYNLNNGTGGPSSGVGYYNKSYTIPNVEPTRNGYEFLGWELKSTLYSPGSSFTVKGNTVLKAKWEQGVYTIKYNSNGGTGSISPQSIEVGKSATIRAGSSLVREGYDFKNWNTKADGSGTTYTNGQSYTGKSNLTLYAQWTPWQHTLKYYLTEEDKKNNKVYTTQTKKTETNINIIADQPTLEGYVFRNWEWTPEGLPETEEENDIEKVIYIPGQKYSYDHPVKDGIVNLVGRWADINGDILFYKDGKCECLELVEQDAPEVLFYKNGKIVCREFLEKEEIYFTNENQLASFQFIENIEN